MSLQEEIDLLKRDVECEGEYGWHEFEDFPDDVAEAIATILNAVVKGELKE